MRFLRFTLGDGHVRQGFLASENTVQEISGDYFSQYAPVEATHKLEEIKLLPPCRPSKIVCVGLNYKDHATELDFSVPKDPVIFLKPPTALLEAGGVISLPPASSQVDFEAELAIVIGREAKNLALDEVKNAIFGYTCANDVTARDIQKIDGQWTRAKSFDTFLPLGPYICTDVENPQNLAIELRQNSQIRQNSSTSEMIFSIEQLVSFISGAMTLFPQDVIITGTPSGIGPMQAGDLIEVSIERIGVLKSLVKQAGPKFPAS